MQPGPEPDAASYALTRFLVLRLLGVVYLVAFLVAARQAVPLIGHDGLLPADHFLDGIRRFADSPPAAFLEVPTLFWLGVSDPTFVVAAWIGVALSAAVVLGATNAILQVALWALYLSFEQVGQLFWGYGWEIQLCETGFLAIFLCGALSVRPFASAGPPVAVMWLLRWLIVRIMLGAAAIKLRGDPCWRDFSCLTFHYETQPIPNPLSWWLHAQPAWFHATGVAFNHLVELVAPFLVIGPRGLRLVAGSLFVAFQLILIASGNLSFLNWLTIVPALACFDDRAVAWLFPRRFRERAATGVPLSKLHLGAALAVAVVVGLLSVNPVANLLSPAQAMNRSYDPLHLVNTYGAFGAVGKMRPEIVIEGTSDATIGPATRWREYEFPCKPGDVARRPCWVSPYHYRLDWQLWFAAMSSIEYEPWLVRYVARLLQGDAEAKRLLAIDPFPDEPPRFIRILLYRYRFTRPSEETRNWWQRTLLGEYLRPVSRDQLARAGVDR